jgi:hypothetical protein
MPATRSVLLGWVMSLLSATTAGAAPQVLPDTLQACRNEPDDARRLQCYDREVGKFPTYEQAIGLHSPQVPVETRETPAPPAKVKLVTAVVVGMRERPHAGFVVTLDNGQIWAQNEMDAQRGIRVGDAITIKPGALGSFWLVGPSGWSTKARRIQ